MSYSLSVRAPNKAAAVEAVAAKLAEIVSAQVCHTKDWSQAQAAAAAFIGLLPDDPTKDVMVSMSGSLAGDWAGNELVLISGASVSINTSLTQRQE